MRTIHIHQAEIIEFEERESDYIAAIESQTTDEGGIQTYVILMDPEQTVRLVLGCIYSRELDIPRVHQEAIELLMDSDYCDLVWEHNKKIE